MKPHPPYPILSLLLLLGLLSALTVPLQARLTWVTNNGTITITGGCPSSPGGVNIPDTITGLPVTSIGDSAFLDCTNVTDVVIGNRVTSIGYSAFRGCYSPSSVTIPKSIP